VFVILDDMFGVERLVRKIHIQPALRIVFGGGEAH
jgi:hypothetical protein